jgi:hypothetical protein
MAMLVEDERTERTVAFKQLELSVRALAMSASDQLNLFPENVVTADELAGHFDRAWSAVRLAYEPELSALHVEVLTAVERKLVSMSRDGAAFDLELWTDFALRSNDQWEAVRALALEALTVLGAE